MSRLDFTPVSIDGEECMANALSKIEDGLKDVVAPAVRSEDEESPGLLMLLRDYLAGLDPTWQAAGALEIAFELGRAAEGGKYDEQEWRRHQAQIHASKSADARAKQADRNWRSEAMLLHHTHRGQF